MKGAAHHGFNYCKQITAIKKNERFSQDVLAEKLGVSRQAVSKWERAESSPDTNNLIALANLYGLTLDDLLNTSEDVVKIKTAPKKRDVKGKMKSLLSKANDFGLYPQTALNMLKFPFAIVIPLVYVVLSLATDLWHPLWIIFLTIPIYYRIAIACKANNKKFFLFLLPVPEAAVTVFLLLGCLLFDAWRWAWMVLLLIPIYYWAVLMMKNQPKE